MYFEITLRPRVSETDMLGHINNVSVVAWFEEGRSYMTRQFAFREDQLPPFILARIEVDYLAQIYFGSEVTVKSGVEKLGNSSITIVQQIWQKEQCCARARSVLVHFDRAAQRPATLPDALREGFSRHLVSTV